MTEQTVEVKFGFLAGFIFALMAGSLIGINMNIAAIHKDVQSCVRSVKP